tara:strand:- start:185 stop:421 length:237 start_codon:yes stop_codon:yes gene_type:complete
VLAVLQECRRAKQQAEQAEQAMEVLPVLVLLDQVVAAVAVLRGLVIEVTHLLQAELELEQLSHSFLLNLVARKALSFL